MSDCSSPLLTPRGCFLQSLQLATDSWQVEAGQVLEVQSSFFDALPAGTAQWDSVLVMRDVPIICSVPKNNRTIDRTLAPRAQRGQIDTD